MKNIILKITAILLILAGSFACEKNDNENENETNTYRENIIGRWKLTEIKSRSDFYSPFDIVDYSNNNIIYDFLADDKLVITGYVEDDLTEGEHIYKYQKPNVCPVCLPGPNLQIDNNILLFCMALNEKNIMTIGGEAGGFLKILVKLN